MSFQLVPKSVTLNDLKRSDGCYIVLNLVNLRSNTQPILCTNRKFTFAISSADELLVIKMLLHPKRKCHISICGRKSQKSI